MSVHRLGLLAINRDLGIVVFGARPKKLHGDRMAHVPDVNG